MMRDSTLTEFGEIHPDKTCYTGKPPKGKTAIYPYLFTDWLQMHQPDGDSMNFTFRFAITSYRCGPLGERALPACTIRGCAHFRLAGCGEIVVSFHTFNWSRSNLKQSLKGKYYEGNYL